MKETVMAAKTINEIAKAKLKSNKVSNNEIRRQLKTATTTIDNLLMSLLICEDTIIESCMLLNLSDAKTQEILAIIDKPHTEVSNG